MKYKTLLFLIQMKSFISNEFWLKYKHLSWRNTFCLCRTPIKLNHLLSRSTSFLIKFFIKMKAFITFYSDEVLHFKRVLIEIKPFTRKKHTLFMQNSLKTKPFSIKKYLFTTKALYWNNSLHYFLFWWSPLFQRRSN